MANNDLTVIYYTSNWLDEHNPYFLANTKLALLKAIDDLPLIVVSHKPLPDDDILMQKKGDTPINICVGDIGRSHLNIYKQILIGSKAATTKYVGMAEDDILYHYDHFHTYVPPHDKFAYNMSKWSIFTWTKPPLLSFRNKRMVVNSLISKRDMLVNAMEERFARWEELKNAGENMERYLSKWGDPGRYEDLLGVKVRQREDFWTTTPNIVYSHPEAYGYVSRGMRKRLGDIRAIEIPYWGRAEDLLKLYYE